jgi:hypothetical protein
MASPGLNPHKKGEHVFNDLSGSLDNALSNALRADSVKTVALVGRFSELRLADLPNTTSCLNRIRQDRILTQARTVVAPATGLHDDPNSKIYGIAKKKLEDTFSAIIVATGALIWKKKPSHSSSFHEFESIIATLKSLGALKVEANEAINKLVDSGYDPIAEASALAEAVGPAELARRRSAITSMKQHWPILKQNGYSIVTSLCDEVERVLEARIGSA